EKVIEGILQGKLRKLMSEICLMDQGFVRDEKTSVAVALAAVKNEAGFNFEIVDYTYIRVGAEA
ncbi:MAG: elongation factor Ts, partial [Spirochaetaceae bacterium]|nr:elongation factor Ts [Spirochaetaceae bacterium]